MSSAGINKKLAMRFGIGAVALVGLVGGYMWFNNYKTDPGSFAKYDSKGQLLAIQLQDEGSQAVLIDDQGKVTPSPNWKVGAIDREPVWRADGHQAFFVSDREEEEPHVYRWNPGQNQIERRSLDTRGKGGLSFVIPGAPLQGETAIMTSGGIVLEFDPKIPAAQQLLPPLTKEVGQTDEAGSGSQFEIFYNKLGQSFKSARWGFGRRQIIALMRREDGEVLILQDMTKPSKPYAITAGERVDYDINPVNGEVMFCSIGFKFPDPETVPEAFIKDGKQVRPFKHVIGIINPENPEQGLLVAQSNDDNLAFMSPRYSPDGTTLAMVIGPHSANGDIDPKELITMPAKESGAGESKRIIAGPIRELAWSADGKKVYYVKSQGDGTRPIFSFDMAGGGEKRITQLGRFAFPTPSPIP